MTPKESIEHTVKDIGGDYELSPFFDWEQEKDLETVAEGDDYIGLPDPDDAITISHRGIMRSVGFTGGEAKDENTYLPNRHKIKSRLEDAIREIAEEVKGKS